MAETLFCYHCRLHHPKDEMREVPTKNGKRWRCIKSIEAANSGRAEREAFGRQTTANNKADAESAKSRMSNPERNSEP